MTILQQILAADDIRKDRGVFVPEWNVTVDVYGMTGEERARAIQSSMDPVTETMDEMRLAIGAVIEGVRDPADGKPIFQPAHRDVLMGKSAKPIAMLARKVLHLSGMSDEARGELEKNSVTASVASTSDSPKASA